MTVCALVGMYVHWLACMWLTFITVCTTFISKILVDFLKVFLNLFCCLCLYSAGLGEFRIRDLNDEINKLLREKRHWEERILELGGPDYNVRTHPN